MTTRWRVELLGGLRAIRGDEIITRFRTRKTGMLLAYLAYHREQAHPRDRLIELLWPECDVDGGRGRLSVALNALRDQLEPSGTPPHSVLAADRFSIRLNPAAVSTDVAQFEEALRSTSEGRSVPEQIQALAQVVERYRGELLPGYYEEWIIAKKQRLEEQFCQAVRRLIALLEQTGAREEAIRYAQQAIRVDPLREEVHEELMRLLAAAGRPGAALRQYRELERLLVQELNAAPGASARALLRKIRAAGVAAEEPEAALGPLRADPDPVPATSPGRDRAGSDGSAAAAPHHSGLPASPGSSPSRSDELEPIGGAVPLGSPFYIARPADEEFAAAIARRDSIVLVKGTRQVGKSSLLIRGLQHAREAGIRVVLTDFQMFNAADLESADRLLLTVAQSIAEQLDLSGSPAETWDAQRGPNPNFRRFMLREVLGSSGTPLVWGLDQVDRLFSRPFGPDLFGLFRSWHNERAFDPSGPWSRLTLGLAYAMEAHLLIPDRDQSPFNVGTRVTLEDLSMEQVSELNRRYGCPLNRAEVKRFYTLVSGHPYLVRRGLHEMASHGIDIAGFEELAGSAGWIYGDHLRRMLLLLEPDAELREAARAVLRGQPCPSLDSFYRLRSAGVVTGSSERDVRPRCQLYVEYLTRHLT